MTVYIKTVCKVPLSNEDKAMTWHKLVFEIGGKLVGGLAESIGHAFGKKTFGGIAHGGANQDSAIAQSLSNNSEALRSIADAQSSLARVQQEQNKLKQAELMINAVLTREQLAQQADLARQERELKTQLSELWRNLQRELQQNDLQSREKLQTRQIQADWDKIKLPTIFSRQELEALAQDTEHPLFVCAKMQITEGCPNYFRTELTAEAESQIKKFANSVFRGDVRFYSRFFDDENIFDTNAAQLRSIIPDVPCVMSFSKVTRRSAFFHYHLWGSRSAEILHGHFDVELPWRELAQQLRDELAGASIDDDDLYETIGDWLTTFQKIYTVFFVDLYALVDGDNPFYATKLDSVNIGLPEDIAGQYIQPLMEILQRVQKERIDAFNEELRRQQEVAFELPNGGGLLEFVPIFAGQSIAEFRMSKYPITQRQYQAIMGTNPSYFKDDYDDYIGKNGKLCLALDRPVEKVFKSDAEAFCRAVSDLAIFKDAKLKIWLPTEAQWEYACRDRADPNRKTKFWFGDNDDELQDHAWYQINSEYMTHSVKEREDKNTSANFKLVDMHGNVWEWCADVYNVCGGSWHDSAGDCGSGVRNHWFGDGRRKNVGFRVVLLSSVS
jgi:hypothetical protein